MRLKSLTPKLSLKTKTRAVFALLLVLFATVAAYAFLELSAVSKQAESSKMVWEARIVAAHAILVDAQNYRIAEALRQLEQVAFAPGGSGDVAAALRGAADLARRWSDECRL